jgi:membrane protease YdiL (CAAX protease family)
MAGTGSGHEGHGGKPGSGNPMNTQQPNIRRANEVMVAELLLLFVGVPTVGYFLPPLALLLVFCGCSLLCLYVLLRDGGFDRTSLWRYSATCADWRAILVRFVLSALLLVAAVYLLAPGLLFALITHHPLLWIGIILLYPVLSAYPQELIYRAYFFHRYGQLFVSQRMAISLNASLFAYLHIVFHNWIAVALTLIGGMYFATTYARTRSTLLVSLEHALYGSLIFTLGLGQFFYIDIAN